MKLFSMRDGTNLPLRVQSVEEGLKGVNKRLDRLECSHAVTDLSVVCNGYAEICADCKKVLRILSEPEYIDESIKRVSVEMARLKRRKEALVRNKGGRTNGRSES